MKNFIYNNNVRTTLYSNFNIGDTSININIATSPFNNPAQPTGNQIGVLTIADNEVNPTKIEIINYTIYTDNSTHITLSGITRGCENTTEQNFLANNFCMQAITKEFTNQLYEFAEDVDTESLSAAINENITNINNLTNITNNLSNSISDNYDLIQINIDNINSLNNITDELSSAINDNINNIDLLTGSLSDYIPKSTISSKGEIIVGVSDSDVLALSAGPDRRILISDSNEELGVRWGLFERPFYDYGATIEDDQTFTFNCNEYEAYKIQTDHNLNINPIGNYTNNVLYRVIWYLVNAGSVVITWDASILWSGGTAPSFTASGLDVIIFTTIDGGVTWQGSLAGLDYK